MIRRKSNAPGCGAFPRRPAGRSWRRDQALPLSGLAMRQTASSTSGSQKGFQSWRKTFRSLGTKVRACCLACTRALDNECSCRYGCNVSRSAGPGPGWNVLRSTAQSGARRPGIAVSGHYRKAVGIAHRGKHLHTEKCSSRYARRCREYRPRCGPSWRWAEHRSRLRCRLGPDRGKPHSISCLGSQVPGWICRRPSWGDRGIECELHSKFPSERPDAGYVGRSHGGVTLVSWNHYLIHRTKMR